MKAFLLLSVVALVPLLTTGTDLNCNHIELWKNGTVCKVSSLFSGSDAEKVRAAEAEIERVSCVNFTIGDTTNCSQRLVFSTKESGCFADIGASSSSEVNLEERCMSQGVIMHELLHSLGRMHEQARSDRDNYVTVQEDNIRSGYEHNFKKCSSKQELYGTTYDYESIMHYGATFFAQDKSQPTLTTTNTTYQSRIGIQKLLSPGDVIFINKMYGCYNGEVDHSECYNGGVKQSNGSCYCVYPYEGENCTGLQEMSSKHSDITIDYHRKNNTGSSIKISSKNYPQNYDANTNEIFILQCTDRSKKATVYFDAFSLEGWGCHYDWLQVYIGQGSINPYRKACEESLTGQTIESTDFYMVLDLVTDEMYTFTGFQGTFDCTE